MTTGSRGDIQPFVAIGIELKKAGYAVRIMTQPSETHATLVKDFGLEYVPFGIDVDTFMREDEEARKSMETGDTINFFKCIAAVAGNSTRSTCQPFCDEFIANGGANRPDLLVVSFLNRYFGLYAKHVLKIPTIEIKLQHWVFDDPKRAPMGMPTLPMGMHKFILTKLMVPQDYNTFKALDKCIADIIDSDEDTAAKTAPSSSESTPCLDDFLLFDQFLESEVNHSPLLPLLVCQSPLFKDVLHPTLPSSQKIRFVGPAIIDKSDQISGDAQSFGKDSERKKIQEFIDLDTERKPVYIGWGSMIRKSIHEMVIFAVEALMMSNKRGIVLGGWAGLSMKVLEEAVAADNAISGEHGKKLIEYAKENLIFVDKTAHEWLFPKVSLTIHHGGAGTLNAALRAGVPTIVTPVFGDQYDNAFAAQNLGVGVGFEKQLQKIKARDLSIAIDAVSNNPAIARRAKEVGEQMRNECGCKAIVEEVERYWAEDVTTGRLFEDVNKWKEATNKMKSDKARKALRSRVALGSALVVASIVFLL
jgi:UDP:flavonoid glycosyltransferase YjiC (YdhE family)